jgi:hypothetical protein
MLMPVRVERNLMNIDWSEAWERAATRGLPPELMDFAFRLLHEMLPLQAELARFKGAKLEEGKPGACNICSGSELENYYHAFFECPPCRDAGRALLGITATITSSIVTPGDALHLQLEGHGDLALAATHTVLAGLLLMWVHRRNKKPTDASAIRAEIEARATILHEAGFEESSAMMMIALGRPRRRLRVEEEGRG